jgi:hypothetical protein
MKEVFVHPDSVRVGLCKSLLEQAGIACFIRNEHSHHAFTGIPVPVFYPALCVNNDADLPAALALVKASQNAEETEGSEWQCPTCGESVPPGFDICWNCEAGHPIKAS